MEKGMGINRRQRDRLWQLVQEEWCPLWVRFREATLKAGKKLDDDKQSQASTDGGGVAHYGRRSALHRLTRDSGKVQPGSLFTSEALDHTPISFPVSWGSEYSGVGQLVCTTDNPQLFGVPRRWMWLWDCVSYKSLISLNNKVLY